MAIFSLSSVVRAASLSALAFSSFAPRARSAAIPAMQVTALDGRAIVLPRDLPAATVLILGFSRHSIDATTAWEKPTRAQLAQHPEVTFYDMAMLSEVPRVARGFVVGRVRKAVPDILKPNFLTIAEHDAEWKQAAGFDPHLEDAAYVMLVDHSGNVRWSTHQAFSPELFAQLTEAAQALTSTQH